MVSIFSISMFVIENYQKNVLQARLEGELRSLASFALSAGEIVSYGFDVEEIDSSFDILAERIAKASNYHISYFHKNGRLLGDSNLSYHELKKRPISELPIELVQAIENEYGQSTRYSETLKQEVTYFAKFDPSSGYISRVSLPTNSYESAVVSLRFGFIIIILITIAVMVSFALVVIRINNNAIKKERSYQEGRIVARTREITLIQTMSTMLNSAHSMDDAARLLFNILPKLLPNYSGVVYLTDKAEFSVRELMHFGKDSSNTLAVRLEHLAAESQITNFDQFAERVATIVKELSDKHTCLTLICEGEFIGLMHLSSEDELINSTDKKLAADIAEQISFALCNLLIKDQLRSQATRDPLTDLHNRRFMLETFEQALNRAERHQSHLSVLMIDIDFFKRFNDKYGHEAGDEVLIQVAKEFKDNLRLEDIACRYGGEEFCIICPDTSLKDAYSLAEKLRACIMQLELNFKGRSLGRISLSIGVSVFPNHADNSQSLICCADKALYSAKEQGRNCTVVYTAGDNIKHSLVYE